MAHILMIEDDDQVAAVFQEQFERDGHHVDRSAAAYGAVQRMTRAAVPYDLVLMDLLLQGANGAVAALALRGLGYVGPIVVVTGGLMPLDAEVYKRAQFSGRLLKPVRLEELSAEVARHLAGRA